MQQTQQAYYIFMTKQIGKTMVNNNLHQENQISILSAFDLHYFFLVNAGNFLYKMTTCLGDSK